MATTDLITYNSMALGSNYIDDNPQMENDQMGWIGRWEASTNWTTDTLTTEITTTKDDNQLINPPNTGPITADILTMVGDFKLTISETEKLVDVPISDLIKLYNKYPNAMKKVIAIMKDVNNCEK